MWILLLISLCAPMSRYELTFECLAPPHPQEEIINFVPATKKEVGIVLGGYGSAKSSTGVNWMLQMSLLNLGQIGIEVAPSFGMVEDVLVELWRKELAKSGIEFDHRYNKTWKELTLPWRSRIWFRSADNPKSIVGKNVAFARCDEDCGKDAIKKTYDRVREPAAQKLGFMITTTPDAEFAPDLANMFPGARYWHLNSLDNYALAPEVREALLESYSGVEAECFIYGQIVQLTGGVFPSFKFEHSPAGNCDETSFDPMLPYDVLIDFGVRHPAMGWIQQDFLGRDHLVDEWAPQSGNWKVWDIEERLNMYTARPRTVYCDPAGDSEQSQSYLSDIAYLKSKGYNVKYTLAPILRKISFGIQLMNGLFCNAKGERRFFINQQKCPRTLADIKASVYPKIGRASLKDEPVKDGVHDHTRDMLRYYVINRYGKDFLRARYQFNEKALNRIGLNDTAIS